MCATDLNFMAGELSLREGDRLLSQYLRALLFCFVLMLLESLGGSHDKCFTAHRLLKRKKELIIKKKKEKSNQLAAHGQYRRAVV